MQAGVEFQQILDVVPEWRPIAARVNERGIAVGAIVADLGKSAAQNFAVLEEVGAANIYQKLIDTEKRDKLLRLIRDNYLLVLTHKMFRSNGTARRFFSERRMAADEQKSQLMSMAVDVAWKLEASLKKNAESKEPKGFKILLPAYVQTSVNNSILDHIRAESQWERQTSPGGTDEDGQEDDPIERTADDLSLVPDQIALSQEKVRYLNALRTRMRNLFAAGQTPDPSLVVVDLMFGLGLSKHSVVGEEKTMRECCEILQIEGETQARKIARCQVLLDKGLGVIRNLLREELPGVVQCWQTEINVNVASKRDLNHRLDLTEGEVDRLIVNRQFMALENLVDRMIIKKERLPSLITKGAVAAFVPIDLNFCTPREMTDILGMNKDAAKKVAESRPFSRLDELAERGIVDASKITELKQRGAVARATGRVNLNRASKEQLVGFGIAEPRAVEIIRSRPFLSWNDLDDFLGADERSWQILRKNFALGESST